MVTDVMTGGDLDRRIRAIAAAAGTAATHSPGGCGPLILTSVCMFAIAFIRHTARAASGKSMEAWGVHPGMLEAHAQFYMAEVILALRHMHQKGITHRDIKVWVLYCSYMQSLARD